MSSVRAAPTRYAPFAATLLVISATALLVVSQFYVVIPVFDQLAAAWSTDERTVTWTQTVFGFGYSAGFLLWGWATDRYGARRVVICGVSATVVTTLLVAFAPGMEWALALRTLQGVSAATFAPAAFAYLGTRLAPNRRAVALTTLTSSFFAASIVGQVAAQVIGGADRWPWIFHVSGGAFAVAALALALVLLPEPPAPGPTAPPPNPLGAMGRLVAKAPVLLLLLAVSTIMGSFVAVYTAVELSGAVDDPDRLLLLRASGLPAMVLVPLLTPPARPGTARAAGRRRTGGLRRRRRGDHRGSGVAAHPRNAALRSRDHRRNGRAQHGGGHHGAHRPDTRSRNGAVRLHPVPGGEPGAPGQCPGRLRSDRDGPHRFRPLRGRSRGRSSRSGR